MTRKSFDKATSDVARQALLDNRCGRAHPKRHRTRRRSAQLKARKRRQNEVAQAQQQKAAERFRRAARAYWTGEADTHP